MGQGAVAGCGCGAVTFRADLARVAVSVRCGCEGCAGAGWWGLRLGDDGVELLTGWEHLDRVPGAAWIRCGRCGEAVFAEGAAGLEASVRCVPGGAALPVAALDPDPAAQNRKYTKSAAETR